MPRNPHGAIAVCARAGRLRISFPRSWYAGSQKYLTLNLPDSKDNRLYAGNLASEIERDYRLGIFDATLNRYLTPKHNITSTLDLTTLWREYCEYKSQSLKVASIHYLTTTIGTHIYRCPYQQIDRALEVRNWLLGATTPDMARRVIQSLAIAIKWGIRHQRLTIERNPFSEMAEDIRVERDDPKPNAFSSDEKQRVVNAFTTHPHYRFYAPLVKFWLLTGCRPSEGIGLHWEQLPTGSPHIRFDRSITRIAGTVAYNKRSKTNRTRYFPLYPELSDFLTQLREQKQHCSLVFPSLHGQPINYDNFSRRAWSKLAGSILGRDSTPYSCRDTFITEQIAAGVPIALIAKWVDNSVKMIERYYLDLSAIDRIVPR